MICGRFLRHTLKCTSALDVHLQQIRAANIHLLTSRSGVTLSPFFFYHQRHHYFRRKPRDIYLPKRLLFYAARIPSPGRRSTLWLVYPLSVFQSVLFAPIGYLLKFLEYVRYTDSLFFLVLNTHSFSQRISEYSPLY